MRTTRARVALCSLAVLTGLAGWAPLAPAHADAASAHVLPCTPSTRSPSSSCHDTAEVSFSSRWVRMASLERGLVVRVRCLPTWDWGLTAAVQLAPQDPAYDPDQPVIASLDTFVDLPCTGRRETVRLDVFADGAGEAFAPGQLVRVTAYTNDGPGGTGYTAPDTVVRLRR